MFVVFFAILVGIMTLREDWQLTMITGSTLGMLYLIYIYFFQTKDKKKLFITAIRLIIIMGAAIGSWMRYDQALPSPLPNRNFIGTGIIDDTYKQGKYIFTTPQGSFILSTKNTYTIQDALLVMGTFSSGTFSSSEPKEFLDFDYPKRLKMKGLQGLIYERSSQKMQEPSLKNKPIGSMIGQLKQSIQQKAILFYGKNHIAGLVLGMLIGDRSEIPQDKYQMYIDSGLVHIIAVSGGNVVMLTVFLSFLFFFIPFYLRTGVIILCIIGYGMLCGADSSVVRAVLMGSLSLIALFRGKEIPIWRLLSIVFVLMLLVNPYYLVYDVGFLMSFGAVIGTIWSGQRIFQTQNNKTNQSIKPSQTKKLVQKGLSSIRKNYLQPSIGASIGVFPVLIFFMEKMNFLSIIGNLLILPIVPFVMIYGGVSLVLYQWTGWGWILFIEKFLVMYIYKVSEFFSQFGVFLVVQGWVKWVILLGGICILVWWRVRR